MPTLPALLAGEAAALPVRSIRLPPSHAAATATPESLAGGRGTCAGTGVFDLPTERVPLPGVAGAVVALSAPPLPLPLPPQAARHMPLTPTGNISLGRVQASV